VRRLMHPSRNVRKFSPAVTIRCPCVPHARVGRGTPCAPLPSQCAPEKSGPTFSVGNRNSLDRIGPPLHTKLGTKSESGKPEHQEVCESYHTTPVVSPAASRTYVLRSSQLRHDFTPFPAPTL
jgi:hypothetical protein